MPFNPYASRIHSRRSNRIALPVAFAVLLAAGIYMANGTGAPEATETASREKIARLVTPAEDVEFDNVPKGDAIPAPELVRAIEPAAVYKPAAVERKKPQEVAVKRVVALPAGVERFDQCQVDCDTRDPKLVRASYPAAVDRPAPAPPVEAESSLFGLPALPSPGELVGRTVAGTQAAYGVVKHVVSSTIDLIR